MNRKLLIAMAVLLSACLVFALALPRLAWIPMSVVLVVGVYGTLREHRKLMRVLKLRSERELEEERLFAEKFDR